MSGFAVDRGVLCAMRDDAAGDSALPPPPDMAVAVDMALAAATPPTAPPVRPGVAVRFRS